MKILAFLLAMMTLLLSVTPCCDEESNCMGEMKTECAEHCDADQDTRNADPPSSPFYACGTCLGFVYQPDPSFTFSFLSFEEQDYNTFYLENLSSNHLHPPKKPPIQI